ncbi:VIT-domain-containing protein [Amniculicola lignicola CBS 123094]|uniref:VIT-domain-containing protein n=1 Tax=Amniculicola lignicola CBS 123094 TaxID=1392246 RepID=A0A6A5X5B7_9PLEO|nr:VIT-domain-containing protein [Amniculicola lignicola CBS 123094]
MSSFNFSHSTVPGWTRHICALYYNVPTAGRLEKYYLPQVELQAHATILSTTSRTTLTQTFVNPSDAKGINEVRYVFPLYDGVSVVGFTCHVGDRTIIGEVKEKEKAKEVYDAAVSRGETAALFEQLPDASDVFTTTVGNVPPSARVVINITYLGELKHDMEVDGIRFTIPNIIYPRYGKYPLKLADGSTNVRVNGIAITVDAEMADGSFIQRIQSPSHPISISMGTTSLAPTAEPKMTKASATLSLNTSQLDTDFILQIVAKDTGNPTAILETHPTIPQQRALMATLVPKFALPAENPEIVFVCDRSGSMAGSRMTLVVQALKVFLKSLPVGVKFNICSFGSRYSFLWKKSQSYTRTTLDQAIKHVESFSADYGGTEMFNPIQATLQQRYKDIPLDVMLLTDGEIWDQQTLFSYLNKEVGETNEPIRVFSLGIGNGVSHALIEGIAKAGNGFSQTVGEGEKMDSKVVRMLKGALSPHVNDYTLEVKYSDNHNSMGEDEDDFEIIEKVADSLKLDLDLKEKENKQEPKKPISLFDTNANPDKDDPPPYDATGEARYSHLPIIATPKIIQAPQNIPPLFAFNRTSVYLLLGPEAPRQTPKSVILKATSKHGPLELEIPIQILENPGQTIHQLAAKKAIAELEQGRGWLPAAKDCSGTPIREKHESRFDDMVEREAVRLGVQFQVGGKWCSFVAVEKKNRNERTAQGETYERLDVAKQPKSPKPYAPRSKYQFAAESDSDEESYEISDQVRSRVVIQELSEDQHIHRITAKTDTVDDQVAMNRMRLDRIGAPPVTERHLSRRVKLAQGVPSPSMDSNPEGVITRGDSLSSSGNSQNLDMSKGFQTKARKSNSSFGGLFSSWGSTQQRSAPASAPAPAQLMSQPTGFLAPMKPQPTGISAVFASFGSKPQAPPLARDAMAPSSMQTYNPPAPRAAASAAPSGGALFGNSSTGMNPFGAAPPPPPQQQVQSSYIPTSSSFGGSFGGPGGGFGSSTGASATRRSSTKMFGAHVQGSTSPFGQSTAHSNNPFASAPPPVVAPALAPGDSVDPALMALYQREMADAACAPLPSSLSDDEILALIISLQSFEGYWDWTLQLFDPMGIDMSKADNERKKAGWEKNVFITACVVAFLEGKLGALRGTWELMADKAIGWLQGKGDGIMVVAEKLVKEANERGDVDDMDL